MLNSLTHLVEPGVLNWGDPLPEHLQVTEIDVVLAADCVYFEPAFPLLLKTLEDLIGDNTICYFCFKKRRRADMNFVKKLKKKFEVKDIEDDPDKEMWGRKAIFLLVQNIRFVEWWNRSNCKIDTKLGNGISHCKVLPIIEE